MARKSFLGCHGGHQICLLDSVESIQDDVFLCVPPLYGGEYTYEDTPIFKLAAQM